MQPITVSWVVLKQFVNARSLSIQCLDLSDSYHLLAYDGNFTLQCSLDKVNGDAGELADFENNGYKAASNKSFTDIDGTIMIRPKAAKKGWTYQLLPIEFVTSQLSSLHSKDYSGTSRSGITYKIYDSSNVEITASENVVNCVKTIVDFEPTFDYEVIGGHIQQVTQPSTDIRVWVVAVPDLPTSYGGSKEMVGGVNMKFIDPTDKITADGRASKLLSYNATYHSNKLRFIFKHDPGIQHSILVMLEIYKV